MKNIDSHISDLIVLFLNGKLGECQKKELEEWLKDSHNKIVFEKITSTKLILDKSVRYDSYNKSSSWTNISKRISVKKKSLKWLAYASVIIIPIAFTILLWDYVAEMTISEKDQVIHAGGSNAVLYKADGQKIKLESSNNGFIDVAEGLKASNVEGKLIYDASEYNSEKVVYNKIITPKGGEYQLVLPDGTHVWMNSCSFIKFPTKFTGKERKVFVGGELYFDVKKNKNKPFVVDVDARKIKVLGTEFNIKSYNEDSNIITTLVEGKVEVIDKYNKSVMLNPGNLVNLNKEDEIMKIEKADIEEVISWKEGRFIFSNRTLEEIMDDLARWYNIETFYYNSEIRKERFSVDVEKYDNIDKVISLIETTGDVKFKIKGRAIYVR